MNNRAVLLSAVMAILGIFFVSSYVGSIEDDAKKRFGTEVVVLVASRDIKEMETLNETMISRTPIPKKFLEPAAIASERKGDDDTEVTKSMKGLMGSIALVPIKKGEQITLNKLTDPGLKTGLATQIAPGRRAIAIPVNETSGVAKLIKPGDRVDLIAVMDLGGGKENKLAKTILQDVAVLSIGRYVTNNVARSVEADPFGGKDKIRSLAEDFSFTSVTLEVEPAQAQVLALVMASGENALTLSLRNNDDVDRATLPSLGLGDVLGADASKIKGSQKK